MVSTFDTDTNYWHIEIDEKDVDKTAIVAHNELLKYSRMPFGLKNASATFQRAINVILTTVKWQFSIVYIDDNIIFSKPPDQHQKQLEEFMRLLQKTGVTIKLKKCFAFKSQLTNSIM